MLLLSTLFVKKRWNIRVMLYSFKGLQELQADIAYISFFSKVGCWPKVLSFICWFIYFKNLHVSNENKKSFSKKRFLFYSNINKNRDGKMRLQTDQEFKQRKMFELNKKFNVEMYSTNLRGRKAFAAEQIIRELKKIY